MYFKKDFCYHVYNIGNNSQKIFFNKRNYMFFLEKVRKEIRPYCEIIAYTLMPNHFHFMIMATEKSIELASEKTPNIQVLARKFGTLTSSYTQAINIEFNRTGSLFQQKTKAKSLQEIDIITKLQKQSYIKTCFDYIHQNPINANLVEKNEDWQYSSFLDYCNFRNGTMCNVKLAKELLNINFEDYYHNFNSIINENDISHIW